MAFDVRNFNKRVLLTAAGFSRNWGGRLAREMWEEIFSHPEVQRRPALRTLLIKTPLFEDALAETSDTKNYDDADRSAINLAIQEALGRMDAEHVARFSSGTALIDLIGMKEFVNSFFSAQHRIGYIFSLNQDFLMERLAGHWSDCQLALPGVRYLPPPSPQPLGAPRLVAPATPDLSTFSLAGNLNYIKLHGSYLWRPSDGSPGMVLGGGKTIEIGKSPLLSRYHDLFRQVLCAGDVRLFIFGYGFQDAHINQNIMTAVQAYGARIFVWDTRDPLELVKNVTVSTPVSPSRRFDLRPYLCGAASRSLVEVFPWSAHPTPEYKRIAASFLK